MKTDEPRTGAKGGVQLEWLLISLSGHGAPPIRGGAAQ